MLCRFRHSAASSSKLYISCTVSGKAGYGSCWYCSHCLVRVGLIFSLKKENEDTKRKPWDSNGGSFFVISIQMFSNTLVLLYGWRGKSYEN
mmetsp:Transcript_30549/g.57233  ORF Transcript_30549/g.57233 Transcript_30549/m.57233 type:complete len:91 (-) Transcript_30549:49-321(-)